MEFWGELDAAGDAEKHTLEEYEKLFGSDYQLKLLKRYNLNYKGRALQTYKEWLKAYPLQEILRNSASCRELSGIHHFHIDLYGNFIPQVCPGLSIDFRDIADGASSDKYAVIHALDATGIKGLYDLAVKRYGFIPKETYAGKCDLCHDIRRYLVVELKLELPDLQPTGHYIYV